LIIRKLYYLIPPELRFITRRLYYLPTDLLSKLLKKRDDLTPPKGLVFVGPGDFKEIGTDLVQQIHTVCEIRPDDKILDVGCGIGRIAVPLTRILSEDGEYQGFDIVKRGIDWCNKNIHKKYPNFYFTHIDLKNDLYNLTTKNAAKDYTFPYQDKYFDLIILTSVFTHMMPDDIDNYLKEIHRVLKDNGTCFITFFLLNKEIKVSIKKRNYFHFPHIYTHYRLLDKNVKEANIAYEEDYLMNTLFPKNHLRVNQIRYGWWSGKDRNKCMGYQDVIVLSKNL
jgi:ubiquinone/menaquinone biosynthesis C-methylase UbiE